MGDYQKQRLAILKILYAAREKQPNRGWVYLNELNRAVGEGEFALGYLIERALIKVDGYQYRITAHGMDQVEAADA